MAFNPQQAVEGAFDLSTQAPDLNSFSSTGTGGNEENHERSLPFGEDFDFNNATKAAGDYGVDMSQYFSSVLDSPRLDQHNSQEVVGDTDGGAVYVTPIEQQREPHEQGVTDPSVHQDQAGMAASPHDDRYELEPLPSAGTHSAQPLETYELRHEAEQQQEVGAQDEALLDTIPHNHSGEDFGWLEEPMNLSALGNTLQDELAAEVTIAPKSMSRVHHHAHLPRTDEMMNEAMNHQGPKRAAEDAGLDRYFGELHPAKFQRRHSSRPNNLQLRAIPRSRAVQSDVPMYPSYVDLLPEQDDTLEVISHSSVELGNPLPNTLYEDLLLKRAWGDWTVDFREALKDAASMLPGQNSEHYHYFVKGAISRMHNIEEGGIQQLLKTLPIRYGQIYRTNETFGLLIHSRDTEGGWTSRLFRLRGQQPQHLLAIQHAFSSDGSQPEQYNALMSPQPVSFDRFDPATFALNDMPAAERFRFDSPLMHEPAATTIRPSSRSTGPLAKHVEAKGKSQIVDCGPQKTPNSGALPALSSHPPNTSAVASPMQTVLPETHHRSLLQAPPSTTPLPAIIPATSTAPPTASNSSGVPKARKPRAAHPRKNPSGSTTIFSGSLGQHIDVPMPQNLSVPGHDLMTLVRSGQIPGHQVKGEIAYALSLQYSNLECADAIGLTGKWRGNNFLIGRVKKYIFEYSKRHGVPMDAEMAAWTNARKLTRSARRGGFQAGDLARKKGGSKYKSNATRVNVPDIVHDAEEEEPEQEVEEAVNRDDEQMNDLEIAEHADANVEDAQQDDFAEEELGE